MLFSFAFISSEGISSSIPRHGGRVYVEEGHSVTLTCTMTETYGSNYSVDHIYFAKGHKIVTGHPYHRIASNTSVQLQIPRVTEEEWAGSVYCLVPDMTESCTYFGTALSLWIEVISKYMYSW